MIKNVHISLLATPLRLTGPGAFPARLSSSNVSSSFIAFNPAGVAAHPRPRIFAIKFVVICSCALCSFGRSGKRKRITGRIFFAALPMIPACAAISMIPHQNDIIPIIVIQSVTASFEESSAAFVITSILPLNAPNIIPIKIMPAHR